MASYRKRGTKWRAEVRRKGISESGTFSTKAEAVAWATQIEAAIDTGKHGDKAVDSTFGQMLIRYAEEVSPGKDGARWERIRIRSITEGRPELFPPVPPDPIAAVRLADLNERHVAAWRDRRLRQVSAGSVLREWKLLSNACTVAIKEWLWMDKHPFSGVRRPTEPPPRDRRISEDEIERITHCSGYERDSPPTTATARVGAAFLLAIETAMRAGEIAGLCWQDVEFDRRFCRTRGKTPAARRDVPLSTEALRILRQMEQVRDGDLVFQLRSTILDALFRKVKARALIEDLHFHDSRHEGITRLSKRLHVLALARAVGHRDLRMLQVYYNESAEDLSHHLT